MKVKVNCPPPKKKKKIIIIICEIFESGSATGFPDITSAVLNDVLYAKKGYNKSLTARESRTKALLFNSLWPGIWRGWSGSTLVQVTASCLTHQANICTNVEVLLVRSYGVHIRAISQRDTKLLIYIMSLKIILLKCPMGKWVDAVVSSLPAACLLSRESCICGTAGLSAKLQHRRFKITA